MTATRRQVAWFAYLVLLFLVTLGVLTSVRDLAMVSALTVTVALSPLVLIYAWVRFCVTIWRPLYRQEVSPGWCLVLLFAFFAVIFLIQMGCFVFHCLFAP
jgi:hypothetical protein